MNSKSILVIDDSPTITKVVQLVLTKAGYQVQTAADGQWTNNLLALPRCP